MISTTNQINYYENTRVLTRYIKIICICRCMLPLLLLLLLALLVSYDLACKFRQFNILCV